MAQISPGSSHDSLYLGYLRGYSLGRSGAAIDPSILPTSTEILAAFVLGQEHGGSKCPVWGVTSLVEALRAMLHDPDIVPANAREGRGSYASPS